MQGFEHYWLGLGLDFGYVLFGIDTVGIVAVPDVVCT